MDLCNINEIKALLARHGFHFSKAKGQNFLTQSWVPQNIVLESGVDETCGVLEVGPGIGPLTQQLCRYAKKVVAVEVDRTLQPILAETMAGNENLEIIFGDILKTDISALVQEEFAGLRPMACANLPYYITTPVLAALLESRAFEAVTVMVQKEVAQLTMRKEPVCEIKSETMFFKVVRAAFAQRRKTLLNALSSGLSQFDKPALAAVIEDCGFAPTVRGETLDIPGFAAIANALTEL